MTPVFEHYRNQPYYTALATLVEKYEPEVFLIGATTLGRDLAGSVATSLGTGLTADCTQLQMGEAKGSAQKAAAGHPPGLRRQRDRHHRLPKPARRRWPACGHASSPCRHPTRQPQGEIVRETVP